MTVFRPSRHCPVHHCSCRKAVWSFFRERHSAVGKQKADINALWLIATIPTQSRKEGTENFCGQSWAYKNKSSLVQQPEELENNNPHGRSTEQERDWGSCNLQRHILGTDVLYTLPSKDSPKSSHQSGIQRSAQEHLGNILHSHHSSCFFPSRDKCVDLITWNIKCKSWEKSRGRLCNNRRLTLSHEFSVSDKWQRWWINRPALQVYPVVWKLVWKPITFTPFRIWCKSCEGVGNF